MIGSETILMVLQVALGAAVFFGSFLTLVQSIDKHTPVCRRAFFVLMLTAGAWYAIEPLVLGVPTSTRPGLVFAGFAGWVMLRWRQSLVSAAQLH